MKLSISQKYDVLVIGSGIAGLSAAREAAALGCRTAIISQTRLFSGSSFYPGTWGFGLVGPENEQDQEDMAASIEEIGCHIADPGLVRSFVSGINPAIAHLESLGCHPKKAEKSTEREYIPCFDHKHRNWNGLEAPGLKETFLEELQKHQVSILEHCTLLELVQAEGRVCGAIVSHEDRLQYIGCGALILATGGFGSLFSNHLCTDDVSGLGQYLALKAGCHLINMEFMQMMPGYLRPARNTIFNEKTFRFANFTGPDGQPLFTEDEISLLDLRSTYGPFTSRLPSRIIDLKLYEASLKDPDGISVSYAEAAKNDPPEFVRLYFDWLMKYKQVSVSDPIHIAIFSHAANGGIQIDSQGFTGISGLYACGEATGGMHGADRIGGLSTANGLVFGRRAGKAAAALIAAPSDSAPLSSPESAAFTCRLFQNPGQIKARLQELMYQNAMVIRNEAGLTSALNEVTELLNSSRTEAKEANGESAAAITESRLLEGQLMTAVCLLKAALLRKESRGSHYRSDYPNTRSEMAYPISISLNGTIEANFIYRRLLSD